ncbi:ASCH domain-containing protein [Thalassoroseus pseudoceratinae]|uniref:ASCH domain-containing protein n=1 Tax=Thalassoroseus pseudoceratinae TaxID=2713176 RepID=UPI0014244B4C|nr:ASCH domain-containing protein [Thalassoroseus pseudoceratinae]
MSTTPEKLRALSIRQPWAALIMRGEKTVEYRSKPTKVRGRVSIYASLGKPDVSDSQVRSEVGTSWKELPKGVLIGTVEVTDCIEQGGDYGWHLTNPERLDEPIEPKEQPQPVWFNPFGSPDAPDLSDTDSAPEEEEASSRKPPVCTAT